MDRGKGYRENTVHPKAIWKTSPREDKDSGRILASWRGQRLGWGRKAGRQCMESSVSDAVRGPASASPQLLALQLDWPRCLTESRCDA